MTRFLRGAVVLVLGWCLAGCASDEAYRARLADLDAHGVSGALRDKVAEELPLQASEIATLSRKGVGDATLIGHVRASGATYRLNAAGVTRLRQAGVSDPVIDYLLATPALAAERRAARAEMLAWQYGWSGPWYGPYPAYGYYGPYVRHRYVPAGRVYVRCR